MAFSKVRHESIELCIKCIWSENSDSSLTSPCVFDYNDDLRKWNAVTSHQFNCDSSAVVDEIHSFQISSLISNVIVPRVIWSASCHATSNDGKQPVSNALLIRFHSSLPLSSIENCKFCVRWKNEWKKAKKSRWPYFARKTDIWYASLTTSCIITNSNAYANGFYHIRISNGVLKHNYVEWASENLQLSNELGDDMHMKWGVGDANTSRIDWSVGVEMSQKSKSERNARRKTGKSMAKDANS